MFVKYGIYFKDYSGNYEDFCDPFSGDDSQRFFDTKELCEEYRDILLEKYKFIRNSKKKKTGFMSWLSTSENTYELDIKEIEFMKRFEKNSVVMKVKINVFKDAMSGN